MGSTAKRAFLSAISVALVASGLTLQASAAVPPPVSPKNRVVVVTANLREAFNTKDLQDMSDMDVFAKRVLHIVPHRPDVLLLQEVNSKSAHYVAKLFSRKTGQDYSVVTDAGVKAYKVTSTKIIKADMAIVIDTGTMKKVGRSGYIVTRYKRPGVTKLEYKRNARALVGERGSNITLAMASIHVPGYGIARRSKRLATKLQHAYPSSSPDQQEILGGDFNDVGTHYVSYGQITTARFWDVLTKEFHYVDSCYNVLESRSSDYIFDRRGVWGAGVDRNYNPDTAKGTSSYYSDHKFRWAVVGLDTQPPTIPSGVGAAARSLSPARVKLTWHASSDNAGIAYYDVYRSRDGNTFHKIGATPNLVYYDSQVSSGAKYWYRVVARDYSNHRSAPSGKVSRRA